MNIVKPALKFGTAALFVVLVGCGASGVKDDLAQEAPAQLVDTTPFIPVQKFDEKNQAYLPYEPMPNPYLTLKGKIDKSAVTSYIEGRRQFQGKRYAKAEAALTRVTEIEPDLSGPWVMMGDIATQKSDLAKAIEHYQKALEVNDKNVNAYIKLAKTQRMLGQFLKSQNTYADALAVWPDFPEAHLNLGILYDIYLNHPLRAQKHMEAYQFLTGGRNKEVAVWIAEIQERTGVSTTLTIQ